jgi:serine/threonine protein kinase
VQNGTLREYLNNSKSLQETEQIDVVHQMISGLAYLHDHKISHGDFKSLNVLLDTCQGYFSSDLHTIRSSEFLYAACWQLST